MLLHGFGTSSFLWRAVAADIAEARHTAIALDLLGDGESDQPRDTNFGIAAKAAYVERVLVALRIPQAADVRALQRNTGRCVLRAATGILGVAPLLTPVLERSVGDRAHMPWRLVARYLAPYVGQDGVRHLLALAASVTADDLEDADPAAIRVPTLIVRGESDEWLGEGVAERLSAAIPDSQLLRLPGVGRLIPEESPEQLAGLVLDFIQGRIGVRQ